MPLLVGASYWYSAHGDGAKALELAEKALAFEPRFRWAWARVAQGRALLEHGYVQEAVAELTVAATQVGPGLVEANNLLGIAYVQAGADEALS